MRRPYLYIQQPSQHRGVFPSALRAQSRDDKVTPCARLRESVRPITLNNNPLVRNKISRHPPRLEVFRTCLSGASTSWFLHWLFFPQPQSPSRMSFLPGESPILPDSKGFKASPTTRHSTSIFSSIRVTELGGACAGGGG